VVALAEYGTGDPTTLPLFGVFTSTPARAEEGIKIKPKMKTMRSIT
jgi:hypothetical protein